MKPILTPYLFVALAMTVPGWAQVYVSPSGNDTNPGSSRKPVAHLMRAVELARALPTDKPRRVVLKDGLYFDVSATLTLQDSNLIIESENQEKATLLGGVPLTGWTLEGSQFWSAALPAGKKWDIRLLQVNGRFCPRACFPETGTLAHESTFEVPWMSSTGGGWKRNPTTEELTSLIFKNGDIPAGLDIRSAEITVFHMWDESVAAITEHDAAKNTFKLSPPLGHPAGAFGVQKYCIWNTKEGMTRPGQWYFDRSRNRIVYWPLAGEKINKAKAIIPTQSTIIRISGATNVVLREFSMSVTTVPLITGGFAAAAFDGALQLQNAQELRVIGLRVFNVAGQAIKSNGGEAIHVANCEIYQCGAGGIYISGFNNVTENNLVHDVGLMFPSAMGVYGGGKNSRLSHNEVFNTPYSAINFAGENVVIENNLIYKCMKVLHDGAAIYSFGSKNAIIRNNVARDITDTGGYGASSYYLDEQCQGCIVENNISLNVVVPSHNHMATNNVLRNNVFINTGAMRIRFPRSTGYGMEGNVLYATGPITIEGMEHVTNWSRNILYSGQNKVEGVLLKDYSPTGAISGLAGDTLGTDPQFADISQLDLQYKSTSPALRLGIRPLDISQAGRKRGK